MEFDNRNLNSDLTVTLPTSPHIEREVRRHTTAMATVAAMLLIALGATVFALHPQHYIEGPVSPVLPCPTRSTPTDACLTRGTPTSTCPPPTSAYNVGFTPVPNCPTPSPTPSTCPPPTPAYNVGFTPTPNCPTPSPTPLTCPPPTPSYPVGFTPVPTCPTRP